MSSAVGLPAVHPLVSKVLSTGLMIIIDAGFVYSGVLAYHDYFVVWAQDPNLFIHC